MSGLPRGWIESTLGALVEYVTSGSRDWSKYYSTQGALFVRTQDINQNKLCELGQIARVSLPQKVEGKRSLIRQHDLLVTITGANVGKCAHVTHPIPEAYVSQSVALVRLRDELLASFIHKQLLAPVEGTVQTALENSAYGMGRPVLNLENIREVPIKLAPQSEQKRIADKLDTVLARLGACRQRLDCVPAILRRFRQSVLAAASSGRLTEEWRDSHVSSSVPWTGYPSKPLAELLDEPLRNGKSVRDGSGMPVLRLTAIKDGRIDTDATKYGDWSGIDIDRFLIKPADFLVSRGNGSRTLVGRGGLVDLCPTSIAFPDTMIRVRANQGLMLSHFMRLLWDTPAVRNQIEAAARTTAGIWKISQQDLDKLELPVPEIPEQAEIVRRVERLFAFADRVEARLATARNAAEQLTPALLAKAFRGELVPQDPHDEPAAELLKRLAEQRSGSGAAVKNSRVKRGSHAMLSDKESPVAEPS
ncbi:restriction endonuclease subunit S [Paraburkholderia aromaticivorans]|uniref:restriction endonuclease subunit S n=1 Tax=Paraburkholderia aromaticivorans TaxID=2026199 RepID=UPI001455E7AE|nr:restriction endonuclease subunit S [Paraburkholderia aromaticivorans]